MDITRESILGVGMAGSMVGLKWLRPNTPYTNDKKEKMIDCVEFEINHKGIEKLEANIKTKSEYVMCFVHFNSGTNDVDNIYLEVWNEEGTTDDPINSDILNNEEREIIIKYAIEELKKSRSN
jgi:hypothetical protein